MALGWDSHPVLGQGESARGTLTQRTDSSRLSIAPNLGWSDMVTVATAVCRLYIRECGSISRIIDIHSIANPGSKHGRVFQNACNGTGRDVDSVIAQSPTVGEPAKVTSQYSQSLLLANWRWWDSGIQTQQVSDRPGVFWSASRADGSLVLNQRQQVGARRRRNRNP